LPRLTARIALHLVIWLILPRIVLAAPLEEGNAAHKRGDDQAAMHEYLKAAEQGDIQAQLRLADIYAKGQGVPMSYVEAAKWYRRAAEQGNAKAQYALGLMHSMGLGFDRDYRQAEKWFRKAAEQGHAGAQNRLGLMYRYGSVVKRDYVLAYMWFALALANGYPDAQDNLDMTASKMSPEQIAEARRLVHKWKPRMQEIPNKR